MQYLNRDDIAFLMSELDLPAELIKALEDTESSGKILDDYADELRDLCTDRFDEIGFDENYKLTPKGKKFESLIDKLFIG